MVIRIKALNSFMGSSFDAFNTKLDVLQTQSRIFACEAELELQTSKHCGQAVVDLTNQGFERFTTTCLTAAPKVAAGAISTEK